MKKLISFLAAVAFIGVIGCESMDPSQMMGAMGSMEKGKMGCPFNKKAKTGDEGEAEGKFDMSSIMELMKGFQKADDDSDPAGG